MKEIEAGDIESRRFERFDVDCRVKVVRKTLGNTTVHYGRASNISVGGIMLVVPADLHGGEIVGLEFSSPLMSEVLRLRGIVRQRLGNYSFGVEFREMTSDTRNSITRMCETLSVL